MGVHLFLTASPLERDGEAFRPLSRHVLSFLVTSPSCVFFRAVISPLQSAQGGSCLFKGLSLPQSSGVGSAHHTSSPTAGLAAKTLSEATLPYTLSYKGEECFWAAQSWWRQHLPLTSPAKPEGGVRYSEESRNTLPQESGDLIRGRGWLVGAQSEVR